MSDHPVIDDARLIQANLALIGECDPVRRIEAIRDLSAVDGVLHEPDASAKGHAAIAEAVTARLAGLPPDFLFHATELHVGHECVGRRDRHSGPFAVTGAHVEGGLIRSLHVFLDPTSQ